MPMVSPREISLKTRCEQSVRPNTPSSVAVAKFRPFAKSIYILRCLISTVGETMTRVVLVFSSLCGIRKVQSFTSRGSNTRITNGNVREYVFGKCLQIIVSFITIFPLFTRLNTFRCIKRRNNLWCSRFDLSQLMHSHVTKKSVYSVREKIFFIVDKKYLFGASDTFV